MASLQIGAGIGPIGVQAGVQLQLSDLEISVLGGAVKEAQDFLAKNDNEDGQLRQHATVAGTMKNSQARNLKLERKHGHFVCQPPSTIVGYGSGSFVSDGSKAAVIYGTCDTACPQLGYLLAWCKSEHTFEHKVYVEAGELSKLVKQEWCEIERKLDASHSRSRSVDKPTGATAVAEITNQGGNLACLGACFNQLCG